MRMKYMIWEPPCGCVVHLEYDEQEEHPILFRAIDPDKEVVASDEPMHAHHQTLRDHWRKRGRQPHHKWSSTIERSALKRVCCPDHQHEDHKEHHRLVESAKSGIVEGTHELVIAPCGGIRTVEK